MSPLAAWACTGGKMVYNTSLKQVEWCNGTNFVSAKGSSVTSCAGTNGGTIRYNSSAYQFCDTTSWFTMKGTVSTSCSTAGQLQWSSPNLQMCDGSNWYNLVQTSMGTQVIFLATGSTTYVVAA